MIFSLANATVRYSLSLFLGSADAMCLMMCSFSVG
jgi:hypothetical protein